MKIVNIVNKTPHPVVVVGKNACPECGREAKTGYDFLFSLCAWCGMDYIPHQVFPPEGEPIRLQEEEKYKGMISGIPLYSRVLKDEGAYLPPQVEDTYYIVSLPVALAHPERADFLVPTEYVRDENGKIVGCEGLARIGRYER